MLRRLLIVPALLALLMVALIGSRAHAATNAAQSTPTRVDCSTPGVVSITVSDGGSRVSWCYTGVGHVDPGRNFYSLNAGQWHVSALAFYDFAPAFITLGPGQSWKAVLPTTRGVSFDISV